MEKAQKTVYIVISKTTNAKHEEQMVIVGSFLTKENAIKCFEREKEVLKNWVKMTQYDLDAEHKEYYDNVTERVGYWNQYEDTNLYNAELQIFIEPLYD